LSLDPLPSELVTGDTAVDTGHRLILVELRELVQTRNVDVALRSLRLHFAEHFALEEKLWDATGYPDAYKHEQEHLAFFDTWTHAGARWLKHGDEAARERFIAIVARWVQEHVLGVDVEMVAWLKAHSEETCRQTSHP